MKRQEFTEVPTPTPYRGQSTKTSSSSISAFMSAARPRNALDLPRASATSRCPGYPSHTSRHDVVTCHLLALRIDPWTPGTGSTRLQLLTRQSPQDCLIERPSMIEVQDFRQVVECRRGIPAAYEHHVQTGGPHIASGIAPAVARSQMTRNAPCSQQWLEENAPPMCPPKAGRQSEPSSDMDKDSFPR